MRPKKHFGQHFLTDTNTALQIVQALQGIDFEKVVEVGPGKGILTQHLQTTYGDKLYVVEIDPEAAAFVTDLIPAIKPQLFLEDFLKWDPAQTECLSLAVIGNFPYNISSQILFRILDNRPMIPLVVGMFQKEVADRVREQPGSKTYGILSVLIQAYYEVEQVMTLQPGAFFPPPKVKSSVIRLVRRETPRILADEKWFRQVVKLAFNQRRKTLRNALKTVILPSFGEVPYLTKRAEELSVEAFDELARALRPDRT
ncbi:MAG: ribosomal RNA small subunit methyltransferase A [Flavobacteriales bacterium]|nr:ribosomal RNA small subunit methyltransferase A [Flavobacteriales bacterium]